MTPAEAALITAREYAILANVETNARAKTEGWSGWGTLPEDEAYWKEMAENYGLLTGADVMRNDLISTYSDLYKEAAGFRPRFNPEGLSIETLSEMVDGLINAAKASEEREEKESRETAARIAAATTVTPLVYNPFANLKLS